MARSGIIALLSLFGRAGGRGRDLAPTGWRADMVALRRNVPVLAPVALILGSSAAAPAAAMVAVDIPAQPLPAAILLLSRQSGIAIIAPTRLVGNHVAPAVRGSMPADRALAALLAGSGLVARRRGANLYAIEPARPAPPRAARSAPRSTVRPPTREADAAESADLKSEIVVTGSRINVAGYLAPTPVTTVDEAQIGRDTRLSIGDVLRDLPQVGMSASPNNGQGAGGIVAGTAGLDTVNLRQLGFLRTLVLFDGQRVVQSNISGQVDIGTIPTMLVKRVDIVTAGASAAWGSDAVSGVVNLILDKTFSGVKANVDYGNSDRSDHRLVRTQLAAGFPFAGDRGHIILGVARTISPDVVFAGRRSWNSYPALIENPAYTPGGTEPFYVHVAKVGLSQATTGGLITAGPLRGVQFKGPTATPAPFDFGQISGALSAGGDAEQLNASLDNLTVAFRATHLFGYARYRLADWLTVSLQLNRGATRSHNSSVPVTRFGNLAIQRDNAFLPESIRDRMQSLGLASLQVGTTNLNNLPSGKFTIDDLEGTTVAIPTAVTRRRLQRGVLSFSGDVGDAWSWNAYYERGEVRLRQDVVNNLLPANFNRAIDAVVAPAGNAAGVAAGMIVCRSTLTDPADGCAPLNIFGTGVASRDAIAYVNVKPGQNYQIQHLTEDMLAASLQGVLPIGLPAGRIAIAIGEERRTERGLVVTDPGAQARIYALGNFTPFHGRYTVRETFAEAEIPLLRDAFVQSLGLSTALRETDYSTSGHVWTWKAGLIGQISPDLRIRATLSRDVRAPILNELFSTGVATSGSAVDPRTGQNVPIFTFRTGNAALKPEIGKTVSAGMIVTPARLAGLSLAIDYYAIRIDNAIATLTAQQVLARCAAGEALFCAQLQFGGANNALSQINLFPLNISTDAVRGIDLQADYRVGLRAGTLSLKLIGTYVLRQSQDQLGLRVDYAGGIGPDNPVAGVPRGRARLTATLDRGRASYTAQARFIGAAKLVNGWTSKDVDRNRVPPILYVDWRGSVRIAKALSLFGAIDNLFDRSPPLLPGTARQGQTVYYFTATRGDIYDTIGRSYRLGLRVAL